GLGVAIDRYEPVIHRWWLVWTTPPPKSDAVGIMYDAVHPPVPQPTTLEGPTGARATFPPTHIMLVHVWLQGCPDCMDAFRAVRDDAPKLAGLPFVNVAYGQASTDFANEH